MVMTTADPNPLGTKGVHVTFEYLKGAQGTSHYGLSEGAEE